MEKFSPLKNISLIFVLITLSYLLATPVGSYLGPKIFYTDGGFATFSLPSDFGNFLNGVPFVYLFLSAFLFGTFGKGRKWVWATTCAIPMIYFLFSIDSGLVIWLWSAASFAKGIIIALAINFFRKQRTTK